jgi:hypothetical protein
MLKPSKHTDPSLSVLNIAGLTIEVLQQNKIMTYDDLLISLTNQTSESVKEVYNYALSFLYIVGKLEYIPEIDALRIP